MPPREWRFRLLDIIEAAERVKAYVSGTSWEAFLADDKLRDAVAYKLIVIGEATASLPEHVTISHPNVPWSEMRGMRNVLTHHYFDADAKVLWTTATEDLPPLLVQLRAIVDSDAE